MRRRPRWIVWALAGALVLLVAGTGRIGLSACDLSAKSQAGQVSVGDTTGRPSKTGGRQ